MMSHVGYDEAKRTLTILFQGGKRDESSEVQREVFGELLKASSPGSYCRDLSDDCYPYREVRTRGRR